MLVTIGKLCEIINARIYWNYEFVILMEAERILNTNDGNWNEGAAPIKWHFFGRHRRQHSAMARSWATMFSICNDGGHTLSANQARNCSSAEVVEKNANYFIRSSSDLMPRAESSKHQHSSIGTISRWKAKIPFSEFFSCLQQRIAVRFDIELSEANVLHSHTHIDTDTKPKTQGHNNEVGFKKKCVSSRRASIFRERRTFLKFPEASQTVERKWMQSKAKRLRSVLFGVYLMHLGWPSNLHRESHQRIWPNDCCN